jgi:hypothetical protein
MVWLELESPAPAPIPRNGTPAEENCDTDTTIAAGNGARRCCLWIARRIESPIVDFSDDGASAVSSAIRILPGDGVLKLVNFIQVVAAEFGARPQGERAAGAGFVLSHPSPGFQEAGPSAPIVVQDDSQDGAPGNQHMTQTGTSETLQG